MLAPVEPDELHVRALRERLHKAVDAALAPVEFYPSMFSDWSHILSCTPREYAERFEEEEHTLSEYRDEIAKQIRIKAAVGETLPHIVNLGFCVVDCTNIRNQLTRRTHDTARLSSVVFLVFDSLFHLTLPTPPHPRQSWAWSTRWAVPSLRKRSCASWRSRTSSRSTRATSST